MELKNVRRGRMKEYAEEYDCECFLGQSVWDTIRDQGIKVDIALPCATQNEINGKNAAALVKNGCLCVAEGANMPSTPEAIKIFQDKKVRLLQCGTTPSKILAEESLGSAGVKARRHDPSPPARSDREADSQSLRLLSETEICSSDRSPILPAEGSSLSAPFWKIRNSDKRSRPSLGFLFLPVNTPA